MAEKEAAVSRLWPETFAKDEGLTEERDPRHEHTSALSAVNAICHELVIPVLMTLKLTLPPSISQAGRLDQGTVRFTQT